MKFVYYLIYIMFACLFLLAGMLTVPDKHKLSDSILWPLALFWPFSIFGMIVYLLISKSGVLEHEVQEQEKTEKQKG